MRPAEHYAKAVQLMARVDEMQDPTLAISRVLVAQAAVHAQLAACKPQSDASTAANVEAAKRVKCNVCQAKPGEDCRNTLPGGRTVHIERATGVDE